MTGGSRRRAIPLPRQIGRLDLARARLRDGALEVEFVAPGAR